jgi:hypothetical protein
MIYLIYDTETKRVLHSVVEKPTDLTKGLDYVATDKFELGAEIQTCILVHSYVTVEDIKYLQEYSAFVQSPPAQELLMQISDLTTQNADLKQAVDGLTLQLGDALLGGAI